MTIQSNIKKANVLLVYVPFFSHGEPTDLNWLFARRNIIKRFSGMLSFVTAFDKQAHE